MKPGKEYSLSCFAKMHDVDYYMIVHDDLDLMNSYIISYTMFEDLKDAFLEKIAEYPDEFGDACLSVQEKKYSYCANLFGGNRIEIEIGNLKKKEIREMTRTLTEMNFTVDG